METLVVNAIGREKRYALLRNNKVVKFIIEQPKQHSLVGGIYFGTVEKVLPGMNAAFINIGLDKNGYLHRDKLPSFLETKEDKSISSYLHQGQKILVQVEKDPTGNKGPRLTGIIEFNGQWTVYMPKGFYIAVSKKMADETVREKWRRFGNDIKRDNEGILFRTACEEASEEDIREEIDRLRAVYENVLSQTKLMKKPGLVLEINHFIEELRKVVSEMEAGKVVVDHLEMKQELAASNQNKQIEVIYHQNKENIFSAYQVESEIEHALSRVVELQNGAYLVFDEAEALTVIDVNTGKYSGKYDLQDTVIKTNELAALEIARQIRLRDLAGIILIDFIDMHESRAREQVKRKLEAVLREDERQTRVVGFTPLGILQLTRQKTRVSVSESLTTTCPTCAGTGSIRSAETIAFQLERELLELRGSDEEAILIDTTEGVRAVFAGEHDVHQKRLEEITGLEIHFSISDSPKPFYQIRQLGDAAEIRKKATSS